MDALLWIIGAIGSGIIGVAATVLFQDQIKFWLASWLIQFRKSQKRGIEGDWKATFSMIRGNDQLTFVETIRITRALGLVLGHITPHEQNYPELREQEANRPLRLRGEIGESFYLTGLWFHPLDTHRFSGSFQLLIDPGGHEMSGKWVGFSSTLKSIGAGEWHFERMPSA